MLHVTRQSIAFTAGAVAALAIAVGGVALAQTEGPGERPSDRSEPTSQTTEHPLAAATVLIECVEGNTVSEPETFTVACGDGNASLAGLDWTGWGAAEASATGELVVNDCDPDCAGGSLETYEVEVTAGDLVHGEAVQAYGSLTLHFPGDVPEGFDQDEVLPQVAVEQVGDLSQ